MCSDKRQGDTKNKHKNIINFNYDEENDGVDTLNLFIDYCSHLLKNNKVINGCDFDILRGEHYVTTHQFKPTDSKAENYFKDIIYREEEDISECSRLKDIISKHLEMEIYKNTGINLIDFINTTPDFKYMLYNLINDYVTDKADKLKEELDIDG